MEKTVGKGRWLLLALLPGLLALAAWYCISIWMATPAMPLYGNVIMGVVATLALVAGSGLIALMFYSNRKDYDAPAQRSRASKVSWGFS
jgi:hypothetical protein